MAAGWPDAADHLQLFGSASCTFTKEIVPLVVERLVEPRFPGRRSEDSTEMSSQVVYAIVRAGGRQEKVSVGDVVVVDKLAGEIGDEVSLAPVMLVDGDKVTAGADDLAESSVTAEIVRNEKGPKINILKFKNKTGFRKRQGHRAKLTAVKVTAIK